MIVFGTALESKRHYKTIQQYYSVVGEGREVKGRYEKSQVAGQEYTGITVYRNTPSSGAFVKPTWW